MMSSRSLSGLLDEALYGGPPHHERANVLSVDNPLAFRKLSAADGGAGAPTFPVLPLEGGGSTPNDVRHFPPSPTPQLLNEDTHEPRSRRIAMSVPISQLDRSPHKLGHDEERALAEYRESLMYQRIVGFHQQKQTQRRHSMEAAETKTSTTVQQQPLVLLRPRRQQEPPEQQLSLVEMLSKSERVARGGWGVSLPSASPTFPFRDDNPHSEHEGDDDSDEEGEGDHHHHHHEEVFELDL